jgi:peroxiredoxin
MRSIVSPCRPLIVAVMVSCALVSQPYAQDAKLPAAPVTALATTADALWTAKFKDTTGALQTFDDLKGKISIVYFWATWCEPCQKEAPQLRTLHDAYKAKGFEVAGIAMDNADKVKAFVAKHALTFKIVYGGREAIQLSKDLGNSLGGIPFLVVIGRDGKIIERITGETKDGRLEALIAPLLTN